MRNGNRERNSAANSAATGSGPKGVSQDPVGMSTLGEAACRCAPKTATTSGGGPAAAVACTTLQATAPE